MPLVGWARRIATISRRIVVAAFFNDDLDAMPVLYRLSLVLAVRARETGARLSSGVDTLAFEPSATAEGLLLFIHYAVASSRAYEFSLFFLCFFEAHCS